MNANELRLNREFERLIKSDFVKKQLEKYSYLVGSGIDSLEDLESEINLIIYETHNMYKGKSDFNTIVHRKIGHFSESIVKKAYNDELLIKRLDLERFDSSYIFEIDDETWVGDLIEYVG